MLSELWPYCLGGHRPSIDLFCVDCLIEFKFHAACGLCGQRPISNDLKTCVPCRGRSQSFKNLSIGFFYEGAVRDWLIEIKTYAQEERFKEIKAAWIDAPHEADFLVPVSSDPERIKRRLFDPALSLAGRLSKIWKIPIFESAFLRRPFLVGQKDLSRDLRHRYLKTNVRLSPQAYQLKDKKVLLVDDVMTTGASLEVHSDLLLEITGSIDAFCLARTPLFR